jgi:hypothetical protein
MEPLFERSALRRAKVARFRQVTLRVQAHPRQKIIFAARAVTEKSENSGTNDN